MRGDNKTARELASRAKTRFAIGTPGWVKADDIVNSQDSRTRTIRRSPPTLRQPASRKAIDSKRINAFAPSSRSCPSCARVRCSAAPRQRRASPTASAARSKDRQRISARQSRSAGRGSDRTRASAKRLRKPQSRVRRQENARGHFQFAARRNARQQGRRRHLRRVLRLQLRLLQARDDRHARTDEVGSEAQGRAEGVSRAWPEFGRGGAGRRWRCECRIPPARNISTSIRSC